MPYPPSFINGILKKVNIFFPVTEIHSDFRTVLDDAQEVDGPG